MSDEPVLLSVVDDVATITLNRPARRNALSIEAWTAFGDALRSARDSCRALVLTGAGESFCAGHDIRDTSAAGHPLDRMRVINEVVSRLHRFPRPTLARVAGDAVGAGFALTLACDFAIAAHEVRFQAAFARRGLSVDCGLSWLLPRCVGWRRAHSIALLADFVGAEDAERWGIVTSTCDAAVLDAEVDQLARRLAAGPPVALGLSKRLLADAQQASFDQTLDAEAQAQVVNLATRDSAAAYRAFREKRDDVTFTGEWSVPGD